jgi:hypothetical protein
MTGVERRQAAGRHQECCRDCCSRARGRNSLTRPDRASRPEDPSGLPVVGRRA